ncbi:MAG: hypothetical protein HOP27_12480 [Anaerolineales bacterium]|nr:hypothetical protein [Anaerolineales bacterium]
MPLLYFTTFAFSEAADAPTTAGAVGPIYFTPATSMAFLAFRYGFHIVRGIKQIRLALPQTAGLVGLNYEMRIHKTQNNV